MLAFVCLGWIWGGGLLVWFLSLREGGEKRGLETGLNCLNAVSIAKFCWLINVCCNVCLSFQGKQQRKMKEVTGHWNLAAYEYG